MRHGGKPNEASSRDIGENKSEGFFSDDLLVPESPKELVEQVDYGDATMKSANEEKEQVAPKPKYQPDMFANTFHWEL